MTHIQATSLKKYVKAFSDNKTTKVRSHQSDDYLGGWCVRVYDMNVGSIVEVGNPNRSSIRALVTFAKLGDTEDTACGTVER